MGAVECRSTRLYANSGRRCKRAIGTVEAGSLAGWLRGWSSSLVRVRARRAVLVGHVIQPILICGCSLARPLLAFFGGASAWAERRVAAWPGARSMALEGPAWAGGQESYVRVRCTARPGCKEGT